MYIFTTIHREIRYKLPRAFLRCNKVLVDSLRKNISHVSNEIVYNYIYGNTTLNDLRYVTFSQVLYVIYKMFTYKVHGHFSLMAAAQGT